MDTGKFDVTLDATDENFADDLAKALGIKKGDSINIITPNFERVDGRKVNYRPNTHQEFEAIKLMEPENLKKIGCQIWDDEGDQTHWLFPSEWYDSIPDGTEIVSITGKAREFKRGETDDDTRYGALAYGFIQKRH